MVKNCKLKWGPTPVGDNKASKNVQSIFTDYDDIIFFLWVPILVVIDLMTYS